MEQDSFATQPLLDFFPSIKGVKNIRTSQSGWVENKALCPGKVVLLINFDYSRFFIFCKSRCGVSEMIFTFKVNTMVACAKPASFTQYEKSGIIKIDQEYNFS